MVETPLPLGHLQPAQSLELFSWHAFSRASPPAAFDLQLAARVVDACAGLPLTLKVIGSFLRTKERKDSWESALKRLEHGESICGSEQDKLFARLQLSYDDLATRLQRMFLDAACFFVDKPVGPALAAWGAGARDDLDSLLNRCLLQTLDSDDEGPLLGMHNQLRDLGRQIVKRGSENPLQRSRVWAPEDVQRLIRAQQVWAIQTCTRIYMY